MSSVFDDSEPWQKIVALLGVRPSGVRELSAVGSG